MCGIAGLLREGFRQAGEKELKRMGEVIRHRGPDAGGEFLDERVGLAHRRLSIIDLSPLGNQPMFSADGRYIIVFNGEIYNFQQLRAELQAEGFTFTSRTDTEVILALYARDGERCLARLNGMFAFVIWDRREETLFAARDRIGKKPFYYYHDDAGRFAFASEIKSLLELPEIPRKVDPTAVADYLKYLYIPAPKSIFSGISKLPPAHFLVVGRNRRLRVQEYWDIDFSRPVTGSDEDAAGVLFSLIGQSTTARMIADVPLGAFLSGGIDSSAIVALMSRSSAAPVRTCTIGFSDPRHDESAHARRIADLFATDHREYVVGTDLARTVTLLPRYFDEPFADSSAVPTYHVSRLARETVTVALAGDGGDENFGGYDKYLTEVIENRVRRLVPRPLLGLLRQYVPAGRNPLFRKARTLAECALLDPGRAFYVTNTFISDTALARLLADPLRAALSGYDPAEHTLAAWDRVRDADHVTAMLYTDLKTYLPGDILVKVDRMSMAHSLEVRAPLLDFRVVEFAAAIPSRLKINGPNKKFILKRSFAPYLPDSIMTRPKHGFTVPLDDWFRHDLVQLTEECLLQEPAMAAYFEPGEVQRIWREHREGVHDHGTLLWSLLSFALWHRLYL